MYFFVKILNYLGAIMLHDCIYQFLRLFYHSRFKPPQLDMTMSQLATPVIDLVLVLPLILRLVQDFWRLSNDTKMKRKSKTGTNWCYIVLTDFGDECWWRMLVTDVVTNTTATVNKSLYKVSFIFLFLFTVDELSFKVRLHYQACCAISSQNISKIYMLKNES